MTATRQTPTAARGAGQDTAAPGLRRLIHRVETLAMGERTTYHDGHLTVSADDVAAQLSDPALAEVRVEVTSPGDPVRIVKMLDVVEPRTKGAGRGTVFPGFLGPPSPRRARETHVLRGAAVMAAGELPRNQEGIVDMSGPAAQLSPYAATHNVVIEYERAEDATWEEVDRAVRRGLLQIAVHLADAAVDAQPDEVEDLPGAVPPGVGDLPRVAAVTNLQTQGLFKDVFVYGHSLAHCLPTWIDPAEVDDGAVVSGQYGHPGLRNSTWMHQNHPVVADLRRRHDRDLLFAGLVLCPEPVDQTLKEHISAHTARLCAAAGIDAAVVTKEGGGNADADLSLKLDALEDAGVTAVGIFAEMSGRDGTGPPVVSPPQQATAMVSVGNYDQRLKLPAVQRAIGAQRVDIADADADAELDLPVAAVHGSLSPLGWGRLTCEEVA